MILTLHLLIIQITTWVLVPSDTLSDWSLWVGVAKTALFRGLIHINATRKFAAKHSMRWQQPFLRYFLAPILPVRSWCMSLSIEPPRTSPWMTGGTSWSSLHLAEGIFLLKQPLSASTIIVCSWSSKYYVFLTINLFSNHCASSDKPKAQCIFEPASPHIP